MPTVSIIVPIFEVEDYLPDCLASIRDQDHEDFECICVNDVTLDNSVEVAKAFRDVDPRFRIIHNEENRGLGGARNAGLAAARGRFVQFVDSDDWLQPDMTGSLVERLEASGADWAFCAARITEAHGTRIERPFHARTTERRALAGDLDIAADPALLLTIHPSAWIGLWRRDRIEASGARFAERRLYEDHVFFYRHGFAARSACYVDAALYNYRRDRPGQITGDGSPRVLEIFDTIAEVAALFEARFPPALARRATAQVTLRLVWERLHAVRPGGAVDQELRRRGRDLLSAYTAEELTAWKDPMIPAPDVARLIAPPPPATGTAPQEEPPGRDIPPAPIAAAAPPPEEPGRTMVAEPPGGLVQRVLRPATRYVARRLDVIVEQAADRVVGPKVDALSKADWRIEHGVRHAGVELAAVRGAIEYAAADLTGRIEAVAAGREEVLRRVDRLSSELAALKAEVAATKAGVEAARTQAGEATARLLGTEPVAWHPTWEPSVFPLYFQGNTWTWADGFKDYARRHAAEIPARWQALTAGLDPASQERLAHVWRNNVERLPLSTHSAAQAVLLRRDFVFSPEDLEAQRRVRGAFASDIAGIRLPPGIAPEIPAFHYHHGLKALPASDKARLAGTDALDCGAFVGDSALVLARYSFRRILCIEAEAGNVERLRGVLAGNGPDAARTEVLACGVGEADGTIEFHGSGAVTSAVAAEFDFMPQDRQRVEVRRIDAIVEEQGLRPGFIKLDIEGMEGAALRGAEGVLRRFRPMLAVSIYHHAEDFLGIKPWIEGLGLGYRFRVERHNPFDPVYETMLICLPPGFEAAEALP
jgi:FkbM family methyltransferase